MLLVLLFLSGAKFETYSEQCYSTGMSKSYNFEGIFKIFRFDAELKCEDYIFFYKNHIQAPSGGRQLL